MFYLRRRSSSEAGSCIRKLHQEAGSCIRKPEAGTWKSLTQAENWVSGTRKSEKPPNLSTSKVHCALHFGNTPVKFNRPVRFWTPGRIVNTEFKRTKTVNTCSLVLEKPPVLSISKVHCALHIGNTPVKTNRPVRFWTPGRIVSTLSLKGRRQSTLVA